VPELQRYFEVCWSIIGVLSNIYPSYQSKLLYLLLDNSVYGILLGNKVQKLA
jgi:hypothetical protein